MPDTYGHAKDYFDWELADGALNVEETFFNLPMVVQTGNSVNDIIVFGGWNRQ
jgi:hypothetical protein